MTKFNDVKTSIAKQSHIKELILITIGCYFFLGLSLYFTNNDALSSGFVLVAYICSIAFFRFAYLSKQKNGCLLTILGFVPALLTFPISIAIIFINYQKEKEASEKHLADEILRDMQIIKPEELIALIKKQGNKVYYRQNNIYEYINIPIILRGKKDYKFDIIYYFLTNGSDNIKERISRMIGRSLGNTLCANVNHSDLRLLKKYFKEISGLDVKFVDEKTEVEREEKEYKKNKAENYYKLAKDDYEKGNYTSAEEFINLAIDINDCKKYRDLKEKIINKDVPNNSLEEVSDSNETQTLNMTNNKKSEHTSSKKKIKIESCSKVELLTIDGFDEEKADKFISERNKGKVYYDIESFVADYGLMPHQMVEIQDRLIFPKKPKNKIGRKIEW